MVREQSPQSSTTPAASLFAPSQTQPRGTTFDLGQSLGQFSVSVHNITHHVSMKLDRDNYLLWWQQFLPVFNSQSLVGLVDGSIEPPAKFSTSMPPSTVTQEYTLRYALDQTIQTWINVYASTSQARLNHLRFTMQALCKGSLSMGAYLDKVVAEAAAGGILGAAVPTMDVELIDHQKEEIPPIGPFVKFGHTAIQCHNRFNLSYQPPNQPQAHYPSLIPSPMLPNTRTPGLRITSLEPFYSDGYLCLHKTKSGHAW
ncbi:hypothetical protein H6P81_019747 [Aristolochia fimbriata]|uniref:Retrotransposon Copia-like N-terminal domain-containing protein n=1 Tax=Aristolochia fimbriata TaxID=158543 RepID=A0AAV7DSM7_ARIFI|nr:hypothetical protein H6P81_019747 [Aristolochia fimbriata]